MIIYDYKSGDYYCPFCFASVVEESLRCQGKRCMLWIYLDNEKGTCALAVSNEFKHRTSSVSDSIRKK